MTDLKETLEQFRKLDANRKGKDGGVINVGAKALFITYAANNALPALEQAMAEIEQLRGFIEDITTAGGKYPYLNGTSVVHDAYKALATQNGEE